MWNEHFQSIKFDLEDALCSGKLIEADKEIIKTNNDNLKQLDLISKFDTPSYLFMRNNLCCCTEICELLFKHQENDPFLKHITGVGGLVDVCKNIKFKRSWSRKHELSQSTSKANIHKTKLCYRFGGIFENNLVTIQSTFHVLL